jgi:SPP1 family predicted phage head-tail adaptor
MAMNLNTRVTIQRRGTTQDTAGQTVETWSDTGTVWGSIRPISGREYFAASGERAEVTHEIMLRYGITVAPRDRVKHGTRLFDIKSVLNVDEMSRYLKLMCVEIVV